MSDTTASHKKKSARMDMLHGPLLKKIFLFAMPLAATSILQQLFNSADTAVAGRFAGSTALAAVGANSAVITLLINLFLGLSVGANVVIANQIGRGRADKVNETVHTAISLALICGFLLLGLGQCIARPLLSLIGTPDSVLDPAVVYLRILFLGMPFFMLYNFGSAVLRSIGDTRRPLYALIAAGLINVCLNLLLVIVFHLSVAGVAIATVISDGISALLILIFLTRSEDIIRLHLKKLSLKKEYVIPILKIGIPAGLQGVVFSISNVCIQTGINSFGPKAIAGSAAALNFEYFTFFMTNAFSQAAVTFTGQNFGAGLFDRCRKIAWMTVLSGMLMTGIMVTVFISQRGFFIHFFTTDPAAVSYAMQRMMRVEILEFFPVTYEVTASLLRGMGRSLLPSVLTVIGTCLLRIVWVYAVFPLHPTFSLLLDIYMLSWFVTAALMISAYLIVRKRLFAARGAA